MESHLLATINGSCSDLRDRIVDSFIAVVSDLLMSQSSCLTPRRCRFRSTFVYCSGVTPSPSGPPDGPSTENLTVDFVLETELQLSSRPVTLSDQQELVHGLDDVFHMMFELVSDGQLTWSTENSQIVAVSLDSALVQFDMNNCSAGQVLNDRNADVPTCRKLMLLYGTYFRDSGVYCFRISGLHWI